MNELDKRYEFTLRIDDIEDRIESKKQRALAQIKQMRDKWEEFMDHTKECIDCSKLETVCAVGERLLREIVVYEQ